MAKKKSPLDGKSVADRALAALSDSSDDDDDEPPVRYNKKVPAAKKRAQDKALDSSSDDDEIPLMLKKRKPSPKKLKLGDGKGKGRKTLKPLFDVDDEVYACWWQDTEDRKKNVGSSWFPGTVQNYTEVKADGPFGPTRMYDIHFEDGDELDDLEQQYVWSKADYILNTRKERSSWIGVRSQMEKDSSDTWASLVDAFDAYDNAVIKRRGKDAKKSELNRPEKFSWLIDVSSDSESEEESKGSKKKKGKGKGKGKGKLSRPRSKSPKQRSKSPKPKRGRPKKGGSEAAPPTKRPKVAAPAYKNVSYSKQDRKYMAEVMDSEGKKHCLGLYVWEADAALAADKGCMLGGSREQNFATRKEYEGAIQKEVSDAGQLINAEISHEGVLAKVEVYLARILSENHSVDYRELDGDGERSVGSDGVPPHGRRSDYQDVTYCDRTQTFVSRLPHEGKQIFLGRYKLETEAAMAHDKAVELLDLPLVSFNFATNDIYNQAARRELATAGPGVKSALPAAAIESKVAKSIARGRETSEEEDSYDDFEEEEEVSDDDISASDSGRKGPGRKNKFSNYVGIYFNKKGQKFVANLAYQKQLMYLGLYVLQADAAYARDEAARQVGAELKMNFATVKEYEQAKADELERKGLGVESSLSIASIETKVAEMISRRGFVTTNIPSSSRRDEERAKHPAAKKHKTSHFSGVSKARDRDAFAANIGHSGNRYNLGYYTLEADAALAYDEATTLLRGDGCTTSKYARNTGSRNFASRQDFYAARAKELGDQALTDRSMPGVEKKIRNHLMKIPCPELKALNEEMTKKWAHRLPSETGGDDFLASYQKSMNEELELANDEVTPSIVSQSAPAELNAVQGNDPNAYFKPIVEEDSTVDSTHPPAGTKVTSNKPAGDLDDDASLFSDRKDANDLPEEDATEIGALGSVDNANPVECASIEKDDVAANKTVVEASTALDVQDGALANDSPAATQKTGAAPLLEAQPRCRWGPRPLDFPPGCSVMWGFEGNSFCTGTVRKAGGAGKVPVCEVIPTNSDGQRSSNATIQAKNLALAPNCPVFVSSTTGGEDLEGKVLFCSVNSSTGNDSPAYEYTILVSKEANQFQMLTGVSPDRIKYRKVVEASPSKKSAASGGDIDPSQQPQTPGSQPPTPAARKSADENGSQASSQQFFSSNSTITTIDSTPASARRAAARTGSRPDQVDCPVYFPHWMVRDAAWKRSLLAHLHRLNLGETIGKRTNCSLRIVEEGSPHLLIQTKQGQYAMEDLRRAKEDVEQEMLKYIKHDGSCGRMFYDLARGCKLLHPPGSSESTSPSLMQRNPFDPDMRMAYCNVVELPHVPNTKQFHGHYILPKKEGILSRISRETKCRIKLCGDQFRVPTKYFRPYIWVTGDQPALVDKAVAILKDAIARHRKGCSCVFD